MIPRVTIVKSPTAARTLQAQLDELLYSAVTRETLGKVRAILRQEQERMLATGEGDTTHEFVVLFRGKGTVEVVSHEAFHEMVVRELAEHPMALDHCEHETFVRIARGFGWWVE